MKPISLIKESDEGLELDDEKPVAKVNSD